MCCVHEKYLTQFSNRQTKRNKKKLISDEAKENSVYTPNDRECIDVITSLVNRLKIELNTIDAAIGELIRQ